ncbi:hypothetical protein C1H46_016751 [Malus baccata]|uniref:Uncharacterized protein n=1 Tax=Malus baccata TaxID=106549 RepID=A0A540MFY6_MALBA|nr:hypothetical protein C1H46_016751 [Malus baccata]
MEKQIYLMLVDGLPLIQMMRRRVRLITCLHFVNSRLSNLKMRHLVVEYTLSEQVEKARNVDYKGKLENQNRIAVKPSIGWIGLNAGQFFVDIL